VIDEIGLRHLMVGTFEHLKSYRETLTMLTIEVSALRETLQELSGDQFVPIFEKKRAELETRTEQGTALLIWRLDEAIQQLKAGGIF